MLVPSHYNRVEIKNSSVEKFTSQQIFVLATFFCLSALLRLIWLEDMEYKGDEFHIFEICRIWMEQGKWPWQGIQASINIPNPPMSVWVFAALSTIFQVETPLDLCFAVRILNIFAFLVFIFFIRWIIRPENRWPWIYVFCLAAVNPFMVLWQRKIWPPSIFPVFSLMLIIFIYQRHQTWSMILLGLFGTLVAQIQLAAAFFIGPLFIWFFLFDRTQKTFNVKKYKFLLVGILIGILPAIPWFMDIWHNGLPISESKPEWTEVLKLRFWRYWFTEPLGMKLTYSLGPIHFQDFLKYPKLGNVAMNLVTYVHLLLATAGAIAYMGWAYHMWNNRSQLKSWLWRNSTELQLLLVGMIGFGLLLSLVTINALIYRHYLMILFPLTCLFLVKVLCIYTWTRKWVIPLVIGGNLFLTIMFLHYIHVNDGATKAGADYGVTYKKSNRLRQ